MMLTDSAKLLPYHQTISSRSTDRFAAARGTVENDGQRLLDIGDQVSEAFAEIAIAEKVVFIREAP